ncbi:MAG: hypothetical protein IE925_12625 [Rhodobacterales bacterium]|nr:hypothetical protein [Rhodobacterales bacterium]
MNALFFDHPGYLDTLTWLGTPVHLPAGSAVLRPAAPDLQDARGSWPYQSPPSAGLLTALAQQGNALNLTAVIRPDISVWALQSSLQAVRETFALTVSPLKDHLCHSATRPAARETYSARTLRRLDEARRTFTVQREVFGPSHLVIAQWQERIRQRRNVPHISSPDAAHFTALANLPLRMKEGLACITLRRRQGGALAGIFLAMEDAETGNWHAHSALSEEAAIAEFGNYLLFDGAIDILKGQDLWFGGAPGGANGAGVFRFKQRFSNHAAPAHIVSVDLDSISLDRLRAERGHFDFLPDYRDPRAELGLRQEAG